MYHAILSQEILSKGNYKLLALVVSMARCYTYKQQKYKTSSLFLVKRIYYYIGYSNLKNLIFIRIFFFSENNFQKIETTTRRDINNNDIIL